MDDGYRTGEVLGMHVGRGNKTVSKPLTRLGSTRLDTVPVADLKRGITTDNSVNHTPYPLNKWLPVATEFPLCDMTVGHGSPQVINELSKRGKRNQLSFFLVYGVDWQNLFMAGNLSLLLLG